MLGPPTISNLMNIDSICQPLAGCRSAEMGRRKECSVTGPAWMAVVIPHRRASLRRWKVEKRKVEQGQRHNFPIKIIYSVSTLRLKKVSEKYFSDLVFLHTHILPLTTLHLPTTNPTVRQCKLNRFFRASLRMSAPSATLVQWESAFCIPSHQVPDRDSSTRM